MDEIDIEYDISKDNKALIDKIINCVLDININKNNVNAINHYSHLN